MAAAAFMIRDAEMLQELYGSGATDGPFITY
jgi:hypothetical protein